ncbi:response regulator [candidate division KSB1 bacterium]|nr:response regulator [candidate division KSB1 bacterium]NIR69784.1 response regulator [candidate division KSB1 bacterium]NIS22967.1 response regulator [candidate division KSB1 bacterium]NIT69824.1 response regulator [candidate division KSB1 bacterium]NIU23498.1 response regulator [candidate division KSB1 bacterium]
MIQEQKLKKVLIVDDDFEFRKSLLKIMLKAGYQASAASSSEQARELITREAYPLILLDIHMPGKSGLELLKELKKKHSDSKVIIMTVNGEMQTYNDAMNAGAFAYLNKPVKMKKILTYAAMALN